MTDETAGPIARRSKRWTRALVGVLVVLAWASIFAWQHERSRIDTADRDNADAAHEYGAAQSRARAAQARLDDVHHLINVALLQDDQDAGLVALGAALHALRGDIQAELGWWADVVDALTRNDFTRYNGLLPRFDSFDSAWTRDLAEVNRLHQQLGLHCVGC